MINMESNIKKRITELLPTLGAQSQKLAQHLLDLGDHLSNKTIQELASECHVSTATVSRLAQQLGFANFSELKWSLAKDIKTKPTTHEISARDTPMVVAKKTLEANIETLNGTFKQMNNQDLLHALNLIVNSNHLGFFGMGGSNIVALDAYHKFLRTPLTLVHNTEYHLALMETSRFNRHDCAIVISHTGDDTDTLDLAASLKQHHVPMIIITSFPNSPLADYGDVTFYSISEDSKFRSEALLSLTSQIAINDCLYMLTAQHFGSAAEEVLDNMHETIFMKHPNHSRITKRSPK